MTSIFCACLRTLATMNSIFKKKLRLPAHFSYNEFKFQKKCACLRTLATMNSIFPILAPAGAL
jgi:hypothetical protein